CLLSSACRHSLGFTVGGASSYTKANAPKSQITFPPASLIWPSGEAMNPRRASAKDFGSDRSAEVATAAFACWTVDVTSALVSVARTVGLHAASAVAVRTAARIASDFLI